MEITTVAIENPDNMNLILGQSHFIETVEDLYEILVGAAPGLKFGLAFSEASRAVAFLRGRGYVVPEDVKEIARDVLRHRVLLTYEAEAEDVTSDTVVDRILERVEVP